MTEARGFQKPRYLRLAEDGLKDAVLEWYVSKITDDGANARLYQAASDYAYAIYGNLGDRGAMQEKQLRVAARLRQGESSNRPDKP